MPCSWRWLHDGDLSYENWLLDPAGNTPRQQSPYNRQTRAGLIDLHLLYPHQLTAAPKLSLAQAGVGGRLAAGPDRRRRGGRAPATRPAAPGDAPVAAGAAVWATVPFWLVALGCWIMTFTVSAPVWERVPGLALLQFPWRLLGPLAFCLAIAVAGGLVPLLRALEGARHAATPATPGVRDGGTNSYGRAAGWLLLGSLTLVVAVNGAGDRTIPYDDIDAGARAVDATSVVVDEQRDPKTVGTTSGREFLPRQVEVALYSRGAFRYRDVMERLYPEADWLGGRLSPLSGDVRFLEWRAGPLRLTVRVANDGSAPARIGIRQLDFPGWRAWLDGQPAPVEVAPAVPEQQTAPGFIVLSVPPGEHTIGIAFGPSTRRLAGMAVSLVAVLVAGVLLAARLRRTRAGRRRRRFWPSLLPLVLAGSLVWRGVRPDARLAALLPLPASEHGRRIWRANDLDGQGNARTGLVVNVGEAVRRAGATVSSPSGSALGVDRFVDVRQLTVADEDDPERGAWAPRDASGCTFTRRPMWRSTSPCRSGARPGYRPP